MMNNCLVVFADDIDTKLLRADVTSITRVRKTGITTMSSLFSSYGSDSTASILRRSPFINVPLELLTSLI